MNKFVKEQLSKVKTAEIPPYDDTTVHMIIPRNADVGNVLKRDKCYLIQIAPYVISPPDGYTLHDNWNNGITPKYEYMKVEVNQLMGRMVRVTAVGVDNGVDTNEMWNGWLPVQSIKIIKEL